LLRAGAYSVQVAADSAAQAAVKNSVAAEVAPRDPAPATERGSAAGEACLADEAAARAAHPDEVATTPPAATEPRVSKPTPRTKAQRPSPRGPRFRWLIRVRRPWRLAAREHKPCRHHTNQDFFDGHDAPRARPSLRRQFAASRASSHQAESFLADSWDDSGWGSGPEIMVRIRSNPNHDFVSMSVTSCRYRPPRYRDRRSHSLSLAHRAGLRPALG
jgi:hypothetical protein